MSLATAESGLTKARALKLAGIGVLVILPFFGVPDYFMHILIQMLIWAFVYTSWAVMGRFGIVSLGHGAFMGIGAYTVALLWNFLGVTPWIGIPSGIVLSMFLALLVGYPCFRFRIVGHYFALVTLALGEVVRLTIIALRDYTGGSLGLTPNRYSDGTSWYALQFADKEYFYAIALIVWLAGIGVWVLVERSMMRYALIAVEEDEDAAASVGIHVTVQKLYITALSAAMTALGGSLYVLYLAYVNPNSVSGVVVSLHIVFAVIVGGMYTALGPTVGALFTIALSESLRISFGAEIIGLDNTIYGILLILFIIFLPKGILGSALELFTRRRFGAGGLKGNSSGGGATASKAGAE